MSKVLPVLTFCVSLLGLASVFAASDETPIAFAQAVELEDGDTYIFLGDSITHQCLYTQYVETYFYTRYPSKRIHFRNAGVSGDAAADALLRFDEEVAKYDPDYVSVLLGMNDGRYRHFDQKVFGQYEKGMSKLFRKLGKITEAIPMGPTYFDSRSIRMHERAAHWVKQRGPMRDYYQSVLGFYAEWVAEQAQLAGVNFVDMSTPMRRVTFEQRRIDPKFTLSYDAVHPEPKGHVVMATAMLADAFLTEPVSEIEISLDKKGRVAKSQASGTIDDLSGKKGTLSFEYTATGLPWVLAHDAEKGFELTDARNRFSKDLLKVTGLKTGNYELKIDLVPIATFSAGQLEVGVELQSYDHAPQAKQALVVAKLNKDRNEQAIKPMRDLWLKRKSKLRAEERWLAKNGEHADYQTRKEAFDGEMALFYSQLKDLEALALEFEDKIYAANQVPSRAYSLSLAGE